MTKRLSLALFLMASLSLVGCSDDPAPGTVSIWFEHDVDGTALVMNQVGYTTESGDQYSVATLVYYVSDIELLRTDGGAETAGTVHYRDAADEGTRSLLVSDLTGGTYDRIRFTYGLNDTRNVTDGLPPTTENINMAWPEPMGGGYHYMKLEGNFIPPAGGDPTSYRTHTGRNGSIPHFFSVTLPFDATTVDNSSFRIVVSMDINEWYANPNTLSMTTDPIMANVERQNELAANGETAFAVREVLNENFAVTPTRTPEELR